MINLLQNFQNNILIFYFSYSRYIYTDTIVFNTVEEAIGVLYAAKKYMLPHLSQKCHDYVLDNLSPNNVLLVYEFAEEIQEVKLMEPSLKVMCECCD